MGVVTDGFGKATNLVTRTADEISAALSKPFGVSVPSGASVSGLLDPAAARRSLSKIGFGGDRLASATSALGLSGAVNNVQFNNNGRSSNGTGADWRVRVSISPNSGILYRAEGDVGVLGPLKDTDGVIFPYVPNVTITHMARYGSQQLTHTNFSSHFYESSEVQAIQISADFTVQNSYDARYILASLYFFRAATKMFYGNSGSFQGAPPPIVYLDGYGAHYLPHVPCVITSFSHTMPSDVDYIEVLTQRPGETKYTESRTSGGALGVGITLPGVARTNADGSIIETTTANNYPTRLPTSSSFNLTLQPVYSRAKQRSFDYQTFAKGDLITKGII